MVYDERKTICQKKKKQYCLCFGVSDARTIAFLLYERIFARAYYTEFGYGNRIYVARIAAMRHHSNTVSVSVYGHI